MARAVIHKAYGLDIDNDRITVVRAEKRKKGIVYEVLADAAELSSAGPIIEEITGACKNGRAISSAASLSQDSFIRLVEAPFPSVKKASAVFPSMLDIQLPFPLEKCVYQFARIHKGEKGKVKAIAVAVPKERLKQRLDVYQDAGLDPEWVDQEAIALWRFSEKDTSVSSNRPRVILYLDRSRTVVVIGDKGMPLSSFSTKNIWSDGVDAEKFVLRLKQQIAGALGVSGNTDPSFLVSGPLTVGDLTTLQSLLGARSENWNIADDAGSYLARALAHGVLEPGEWSANLRCGEYEHAHIAQLNNREQGRALAVLAAASLILIAVSLISSAAVKQHHEKLQQQLQDEAAALTGIPTVPRGQEVFVANQYVEEAGETHNVFNEWLEPTAYPMFKQALETAGRLKMTLDTVAVRPRSLLIKGTCADWKDPEKLIDPYRELAWKSEIERKDAGGDERVHFTLRMQP